MAVTIRKDGGGDLGPNAKTATYSILPGENGAIITRRGEPWRRGRVKDDVNKGVMTVAVTPERNDGNSPSVADLRTRTIEEVNIAQVLFRCWECFRPRVFRPAGMALLLSLRLPVDAD